MKRPSAMSRTITAVAGAFLFFAFLAAWPAAARTNHKPGDRGFKNKALPIVFVHGFNGSAAQYETQALRWASNDYPKPVTGIDRSGADQNAQLDDFIDDIRDQTGDSRVYVVAHSAGTFIMAQYLNSSPERAARVAKYIGIDGLSTADCPGGVDENGDWNVPCMGIWARGNPDRMVGPDYNVQFAEQGHTQSVGSEESFIEQYKFFTGKEPKTTSILAEHPGRVKIAGRALNYPVNTGIEGATLQLWNVNRITGERKSPRPEAEVILDATGNFGPWRVDGRQRYEINVIRPSDEGPRQNHFYYEPFIRSNHLLRLNISPIGSALSEAIVANSGPHTGVSVVRQKEWWGSNEVDPTNVDVLSITTTTPEEVERAGNVVTPETAPYSASTIAMLIFDVGADGITHADALVSLGPFLSGIDVYMPAPQDPPNGKISFVHQQRGTCRLQVINTPNWSMEGNHYMTVTFRDWSQDMSDFDLPSKKHSKLPIVFVHGALGSAAQYETQALRWASNDYPKPVIAIDRTTSNSADLNPMLDDFFDAVMAETGDDQVYVLAHSLGVNLMNNYLNSSPERTARVASYFGFDSQSAGPVPDCPGGLDENGDWNVPCMGLYRKANNTNYLGPETLYLPDYGHTDIVTSAESFVEQYKFFTGKEPKTAMILPEPPWRVEIAGRTLNYPANTGIEGATLQLWKVNGATGERTSTVPEAEMILDATGDFGPWPVNGDRRYEINVIRPSDEGPRQNHFYYEPFVRSNYLLRLNISPIGSTLSNVITANAGPHTGVSVVRQKEWWGSNTFNQTNVDVLDISTTTPGGIEKAGNVVTPQTAPYTAFTIAMIMFDVDADGQTNTDALVNLGPFLSGIDVYMPAPQDPPNGTVTFAHQQRKMDQPQVIHTPNWPMEAFHFMTVNFREWAQDIDTWEKWKAAHHNPWRWQWPPKLARHKR
ncbi:MAG: alpha/beta hydrolase [Desulfobacteraceae bacterium]|nr:MAG: alpha/beta hydrolase [Desulfobacteraceae bacterium]